MKVIYSDKYYADIGQHVFPMMKYKLIRDSLLEEKILRKEDFLEPEPASLSDVLLVHTQEYAKKLTTGNLSSEEEMMLELPYSPELVESSFLMAGGTISAARAAIEEGIGVNLGGGFHHAFPDHGEGFCVLNDVAITVRELQQKKLIRRALIIDCDLHHGNGTAFIFRDEKKVFTFSMHQQNNYPLHKPPSDLDVGLKDLTGTDEYLRYLKKHLPEIIDTGPDIVLYLAGTDIYEHDQLGGLAVTMAGIVERDKLVIDTVSRKNLPLVIVMAGGYAVRVEDTIRIHSNTVKIAANRKRQLETES